jgi:hypothetical protein
MDVLGQPALVGSDMEEDIEDDQNLSEDIKSIREELRTHEMLQMAYFGKAKPNLSHAGTYTETTRYADGLAGRDTLEKASEEDVRLALEKNREYQRLLTTQLKRIEDAMHKNMDLVRRARTLVGQQNKKRVSKRSYNSPFFAIKEDVCLVLIIQFYSFQI